MYRLFYLFALMIGLSACQKDANREVVSAQSPDGHHFYFMPIYETGVTDVTLTIAWPTDWAYQADRNPFVPMIGAEVIPSGGTMDLAPQEVMELFQDKNADAFVYATVDYVVGELSFPQNYTDQVVPIAKTMLATPQLDPAWIDRIKQSIRANMARAREQTNVLMWDAARRYVLGDHPVNNTLTPKVLDAIDAVTADDIRDWYTNVFVQDGTKIVVTGAISRKEAGTLVDDILGGLPKSGPALSRPDLSVTYTPNTVYLHLPKAEKTMLGFVGPLPNVFDGKEMTDLLALQVFSAPNGPLFETIRTDLRASYGFQAGFSDYTMDQRIMFMFGEVESDKLEDAKNEVLRAYDTFRQTPDLTSLADIRSNIAEGTAQNVGYVDIAAHHFGSGKCKYGCHSRPKFGSND